MSRKMRGMPTFFNFSGSGAPALISDSRVGPPKDSRAVRRCILLGHTITLREYYEEVEEPWKT